MAALYDQYVDGVVFFADNARNSSISSLVSYASCFLYVSFYSVRQVVQPLRYTWVTLKGAQGLRDLLITRDMTFGILGTR